MFAAAIIPWDQLLTDIHKRQVLPIIGPALVTIDEDGKQVPLIDAADPAKARDGIMRDEECFCEELRFGAFAASASFPPRS